LINKPRNCPRSLTQLNRPDRVARHPDAGLRHRSLQHGARAAGRVLLSADNLLHTGTALTLADSTAGWDCLISLPEGAGGFTTIEGKANFIATARAHDVLRCSARLVHAGRGTQVWDADVHRAADDRLVATYRCTQSLLEQTRR
jgi:1,4-dihydroxy-2-naphthoyl-CoA hydrolase